MGSIPTPRFCMGVNGDIVHLWQCSKHFGLAPHASNNPEGAEFNSCFLRASAKFIMEEEKVIEAEIVKPPVRLPKRPDFTVLTEQQKVWIEALRSQKTFTGACRATGIDRYDIEVSLTINENFYICVKRVEAEIFDELEAALMTKAGLFGPIAAKLSKDVSAQAIVAMLKARSPIYRDISKSSSGRQSVEKLPVAINMDKK